MQLAASNEVNNAVRQSALTYLMAFRRSAQHTPAKPVIYLRSTEIRRDEKAYLVTERLDGKFKVYAIETQEDLTEGVPDRLLAVIESQLAEGEKFESILYPSDFLIEGDEEANEIVIRLGDDWLFAVIFDNENNYTIERNRFLCAECDIYPMIADASSGVEKLLR